LKDMVMTEPGAARVKSEKQSIHIEMSFNVDYDLLWEDQRLEKLWN